MLNAWIETFRDEGEMIGSLSCKLNDVQNNRMVYLATLPSRLPVGCKVLKINKRNLLAACTYFSVRHCIEHTWLNDRDQFLYPNDGYKNDKGFQNDCLISTLFHHQNRIKSSDGINHWIPFTARETDAMDNFQSTFMSDFLKNRKLSKEAKAVFEAGKALWKYYHQTIKTARRAVVDASLYEIREYFKGRDEKGRLKAKSTDERFNELDAALRLALKKLAEKIQPKVYEYGFLQK